MARRRWRLGAFAGGAVWAAVSSGISIFVPLGVFVVFARALAPADIGHFALAVALAEIVKALGFPGLYEAVLQRQGTDGRDQSAALAVFLIAGLLLLPVQSGLLLGVLSLTGSWPPDEQLWLLLLMGLRIPIDLAMLQPQAELARRQAYARLAQRNMMTNLGAAGIGLGVLVAGFPLIGLAAYTLGFSVMAALATVIGTGALCRPRWDPERLALLRREAVAATAVRGAATANNQADQLLVGAFLGPVAFAHFNLGKRIEMAFLGVSNTFANTLFQPHFAVTRPEGRAAAIRKALVLVMATVGAGTACFIATADLVVGTLLGPAWMAAVPVTILMALGGLCRAVACIHTALLSVSGRNALLFKCFMGTTFLGVALVAAAAPFGAAAAAAAVAVRTLISASILVAATRADAGGVSSFRLHLDNVVLPFCAMLGSALVMRGAITGDMSMAGDVGLERAVTAIAAAALAAGTIGLVALVRVRASGAVAPEVPVHESA